jgi:hypothetical protein
VQRPHERPSSNKRYNSGDALFLKLNCISTHLRNIILDPILKVFECWKSGVRCFFSETSRARSICFVDFAGEQANKGFRCPSCQLSHPHITPHLPLHTCSTFRTSLLLHARLARWLQKVPCRTTMFLKVCPCSFHSLQSERLFRNGHIFVGLTPALCNQYPTLHGRSLSSAIDTTT